MNAVRNFGLAGLTMAAVAVTVSAPGAGAQASMPEVTAMPICLASTPAATMVGQQLRPADPQRDGVVMLDYPEREYPGGAHGGYLGVGVQDLSDDRVAALKLKQAGGVEVIQIDHDGPAAKAGIHEHDVILQMNGQEIAGAEQLRRMLRETPAGRKADFQVSRDGQEIKVEVVLGDRTTIAVMPPMPDINVRIPNMQNLVPAMDVELTGLNNMDMGPMVMMGPGFSGAIVESLGPQLATYFGAKDGVGVLVKEVRRDSPAGKSGMRAGDVIVSAAGQPVSGRGVWDHVLWDNRGKAVSVQILREKRPVTISLHIPEKTEGRLTPQNFVIDADEVAQLSAEEEASIQQEVNQAQAEMNSPEFKQQIEDAKAQIDSPEFKQQIEEAKREAEAAAAEVNSSEFKKQMEEVQEQVEKAKAEINSPEFKQQIEEAKAQINSPEFKQQIEDAKAEAEAAAAEVNSAELKKQMEQVQEQIKKAQEEMQQQMTPMD